MNEARFLVEVRAAKNAIATAEGELARLLNEMRRGLRAEKVTISEALEEAFEKLSAAREHLVTLEKLAGEPDGDGIETERTKRRKRTI
ncbi:MAG TPA: hypothetical protein VF765_24835 [Polyangiaceae bacterium]